MNSLLHCGTRDMYNFLIYNIVGERISVETLISMIKHCITQSNENRNVNVIVYDFYVFSLIIDFRFTFYSIRKNIMLLTEIWQRYCTKMCFMKLIL